MHFAKGGPLRRLLLLLILCSASAAHAQRLASAGIAAGAVAQQDAEITAGFSLSAGIQWFLPWTLFFQRSLADLTDADDQATLHDLSIALLPSWEPMRGRLLLALGPALHVTERSFVSAPDVKRTRVAAAGAIALRLPIAGEGLALELLARGDALEPEPQFTALFGVRIRPGVRNTLALGEPQPPAQVAARRAIWNDVLMQLILLQQGLESFSRIREIDTGIELEFDQSQITLYDDLARVGRVLAAADPPVMVTTFAPNAGRAGAALTAGSFPAERLRLQRETRVFLRVEH